MSLRAIYHQGAYRSAVWMFLVYLLNRHFAITTDVMTVSLGGCALAEWLLYMCCDRGEK